MVEPVVAVTGGGLAGCEAAWQVARQGYVVRLFEMRPTVPTPAHGTDRLAELVCSNSLKSESLEDASGLLKAEMRALGSLILDCAEATRIPAGSALAVDRDRFAAAVTEQIAVHPRIQVVRREVPELPAERPLVVATGPLTSDRLARDLQQRFAGALETRCQISPTPWLFFYDAISPIVSADSVDEAIPFWASRYGKGGDDYLNCPLTRDQYLDFRQALIGGDRYPLHEFEEAKYFEGCLPIEELAGRGEDALRFGPLRPVGLRDPRTGTRPYAVVQLRQENRGADGRPSIQLGGLPNSPAARRSDQDPPPDPGPAAG